MKMRSCGWAIFLLLMVTGLGIACIAESHTQTVTGVADCNAEPAFLSKAAIVQQMNQLADEIARLEKNAGVPGKEGFIVYSPQITARLYALYQALDIRLNYLNFGKWQHGPEQWDGYLLVKTNVQPYSVPQVMKVMAELKENGVPVNLVKQFRIFLLPGAIPEVGGLGGAGFALISAPAISTASGTGSLKHSGADVRPEDELAVTLDHEIGHHVHMSFMPKGTVSGEKNWREYLALRGGVWHGPGQVNTAAWSNSSEETFAEDFRMLFGKNQPYFDDIALGDPRTDPEQARNLKDFMIQLGQGPRVQKYISPWIPQEKSLVFWKHQSSLLALAWMILGFMGIITNLDGRPYRRVLMG
jgi:hypothetical protein